MGMEKKSCVIETDGVDRRIDVFLKEKEPSFSRGVLQDCVHDGRVLVNGQKVKPHHRLKAGEVLSWALPDPGPSSLEPEDIPFKIVFEDDDVLVIDKPTGLVVHPGAGNDLHTLVHALLFHTKDLSTVSPERPGIVHRLDKDTSGVMVVAKNNQAHLHLIKQFKNHTIERRYIALVEGSIAFDEGIVDVPIKRHAMDRRRMYVSFSDQAKEAQTFYKVLKRFKGYTAVALFPQTGRTHQLRVHLKYLGHPILGDPTYGKKGLFPRLALHAMNLGFTHPSTGEMVHFSSLLPPQMKKAMVGVKI
jgi:23S rRNA pseudouridine1911/1915/1917 synthase